MNTLLKSIIFAFALCNLQSVTAQTPTWKNITPAGWSGTFTSVDYFDGNGLIAIANNGYFYQSLDTGLTWTPYPQPVATITSISLYPDHKRAYICGGSHLYQTTDAAVSWQEISYTGMPSNINIFQIYIKSEDTLLAGASDLVNGAKIYLSPDKGQTWQLVGTNLMGNNPLGSGIEEFYFVTPSQGYALGDGFYAETTNGGHSWTLSVTDVNVYYYSILEIKGHSTIITTNTKNPAPLEDALFNVGYLPKMIQAGTMVYGVYGNSFYSSNDSGKTWNIKTIDANKQFKSIAFLDQQTGVIVSDQLTTYRTKDGGTTWTKSVYGGAEGFNKIYCKSKDECYVTGNTGRLFHTVDGGTTWNYRDLQEGKLVEVLFPTKDTGFVSAGNYIFRTIDAGKNWTKYKQGTGGGFIYFPTKDTGFIGYSTGTPDIAKTNDAGQTWNNWLGDMTYVDNKTGTGGACFRSTTEGLVTGDNSLLYTNDGGSTWQVKAIGVVATSIISVNNNWLIVNTQNVYVCDKDINCTLKHSINSNYNLGIPVKRDSNTIYLYQYYKYGNAILDSVLVSKDDGNTWASGQDSLSMWWTASFGDKNTVYSLGVNIYKGVFKSQTTSSKFSQIDNQTLTCTIMNDAKENYSASILLITSLQDTIVINNNMVITNGEPVSIKIPNTIQVGTDYKIVVEPIDTTAFSSVVSQNFSFTGIAILESNKIPIVKVVGKAIVCNCENYEIYNTLGQRMQNNTELPIGIYIVKCNNIIQKVIIRP